MITNTTLAVYYMKKPFKLKCNDRSFTANVIAIVNFFISVYTEEEEWEEEEEEGKQ